MKKIAFISTFNKKNDEGMKNFSSGLCSGFKKNDIDVVKLTKRNLFSLKTISIFRKVDFIIIGLRFNKKVFLLSKVLRVFNKNIILFVCQPIQCKKIDHFKAIITSSNDFVNFGNCKYIVKINYCIDFNKFNDSKSEKTIDLLSVGHLTAGRNLFLFEKFSQTLSKKCICSINFDQKIYQFLKNINVEVDTNYYPKIEQQYNISRAFLFPTNDLNFVIFPPVSVLEAAACNLPVIITSDFPLLNELSEYVKDLNVINFNLVEKGSLILDNSIKKSSFIKRDTWEIECEKIINLMETIL